MWENEKVLVSSIFSFSHKGIFFQGRHGKPGMFGKRLNHIPPLSTTDSFCKGSSLRSACSHMHSNLALVPPLVYHWFLSTKAFIYRDNSDNISDTATIFNYFYSRALKDRDILFYRVRPSLRLPVRPYEPDIVG